ncbi:MAG: hypothetical protein ABIQ44_14975, partial [Chloroflexia bacterium]
MVIERWKQAFVIVAATLLIALGLGLATTVVANKPSIDIGKGKLNAAPIQQAPSERPKSAFQLNDSSVSSENVPTQTKLEQSPDGGCTGWNIVPTVDPNAVSNSFYDVTSVSANDAWAVGTTYNE